MIRRKLAAIMFTDIVGYSAMMQANETAASEVRKRHREIFERLHEEYTGQVLQYYGDGTLSIFDSAFNAVQCAISMQQLFATGVEVPLRIGIHVGDIVVSDTEVYGDGVNLASRIETMGIAGNILISKRVHDEIKNKSDIVTKSLGHFALKNIHDELELFAIANDGIIVPVRSQLKGKTAEKSKSIAVLPFLNLSADPNNEYFSEGISEEILNALVKVKGLLVTARTSSFAFKGKDLDIRDIGNQLGVMNILEGSVRKAGNKVRITAQLVSCVDGFHLFSETFDRDLEDIFAVQDEIAQLITNRLRKHLGTEDHGMTLVEQSTTNLEAYEAYLKGRFYSNKFDYQVVEKALPLFERAVAQQPDFAQAHAYIGYCYLFMAFAGQMPWPRALQAGRPKVEKALEIDPNSADALVILNSFQFFGEWNWHAAKESCEKMYQLHPGDARIYHNLATYCNLAGNVDDAIKYERFGLKLDPLSHQSIFFMGLFHSWGGRHEEARSYFFQLEEMMPNHRTNREMIGLDYLLEGNFERAIDYFQSLSPFGYRLHQSTLLGVTYARMGKIESAEKHLEVLKQLEVTDKQFEGQQNLSILYTALGRIDEALDYLEQALDARLGDTMLFFLDPLCQPLRKEGRFSELKKKIGLDNVEPLEIQTPT